MINHYILHDIQRLVREYYEQFCVHEFDNPDKVGQLLEGHNVHNSHKKK